MKPRFQNVLATGLTPSEWLRLVQHLRARPQPMSNPPTIAEAIEAATAAAGRKRTFPLPTALIAEAYRIAKLYPETKPQAQP